MNEGYDGVQQPVNGYMGNLFILEKVAAQL